MLKSHIGFLILLAQPLLIWATNIGQVVAAFQGLSQIVNDADDDVKGVNLLSGATEAPVRVTIL